MVALCGPSGVIKAFLSGEKFNARAGPRACTGCGDFTGVGMFSFTGELCGSFSEFSFSRTAVFLDFDLFGLDDRGVLLAGFTSRFLALRGDATFSMFDSEDKTFFGVRTRQGISSFVSLCLDPLLALFGGELSSTSKN